VLSSGEKDRAVQEAALLTHQLSVFKQRETDILTQMEDLKHEKVPHTRDQCFASGSMRIRIVVWHPVSGSVLIMDLMDPDSYWKYESRSGYRRAKISAQK